MCWNSFDYLRVTKTRQGKEPIRSSSHVSNVNNYYRMMSAVNSMSAMSARSVWMNFWSRRNRSRQIWSDASSLHRPFKPMHTEGVAFAPRKSPRARCAKSNILAQILNQSVVYLERRVESLAVCMPQLNNTCASFYAKDLTPGDNAFGVHGLLFVPIWTMRKIRDHDSFIK